MKGRWVSQPLGLTFTAQQTSRDGCWVAFHLCIHDSLLAQHRGAFNPRHDLSGKPGSTSHFSTVCFSLACRSAESNGTTAASLLVDSCKQGFFVCLFVFLPSWTSQGHQQIEKNGNQLECMITIRVSTSQWLPALRQHSVFNKG